VLAQLRDVFAAENSAVVAEEDDDRGLRIPQGAEPYRTLIRVRQRDFG